MEEHYRFTGCNPPRQLWDRFTNWEHAYDEEGLPDQDESTLRPAENQVSLTWEIALTVGEVIFSDGRAFPAMFTFERNMIDMIYVYPDPESDVYWEVRFVYPTKQWITIHNDLCLRNLQIPFPLNATGIFPLRAMTRLPLMSSGERLQVTVDIPNS